MTGIHVLKVDGKEITTGREKRMHIASNMTVSLQTPPAPRIKELTLDVNGVQKLLKNMDPKKANGPDKISTNILMESAEEIAPI